MSSIARRGTHLFKGNAFSSVCNIAIRATSSPLPGYGARQPLRNLWHETRTLNHRLRGSQSRSLNPRATTFATMPAAGMPSNGAVEVLAHELEKPLLDTRTYRVIRLPNKLEALLIHDPETDKAAAAMDVNAGSFGDEEDMPGMAHAVEHLLFMGTEKYPGENDYNTYLSKYGGHSNAYTAQTSTNYYFEISASATSNSATSSAAASQTSLSLPKESPLYGALDRFSQFFVKPLFLESTLDRELQAVDSENKKNLQSDNWRTQQLQRGLTNQDHPYHKFSTGNYKTLHDDPIGRGVKIRDKFIEFYEKHYSANRMHLAVLGQESLDELQSWVEEMFSDVPNQDLPKERWDNIPLFTDAEIGTQISYKPVMDTRSLEINFGYPDEEQLYASHPSRYISHLIGHEGPGSILAYIKEKGWATSLSSGAHPICPGTSLFVISIRLTESGLKNHLAVVKTVFEYIAMIKEQPPQKWIVDEMAKLSDVDFKFRQKSPASSSVSAYSSLMKHPYPKDKLLSASAKITEFNPDAIQRGLDALTPDNFRIMVTSQHYPGDWDQKEKWYGTEYRVDKLPEEFIKDLRQVAGAGGRPSELYMPAVNEFVPQRLDVERKEGKEPAIAPKLIRNDQNVRTWWKKDDQFWMPRANLYVCFRSPITSLTPLKSVMSQLYKDLVEDALTEYAYDAELAGLNYNLSAHSQGLDVSLGGYNDKMSVLLEKVLITMRDLKILNERFDIIKERMMRGFKNFDYTEPFRQVSTYSRWLTQEHGWLVSELLEELNGVTADDVRNYFPQMLQQMHIEILAHGNLYKEDALTISDLVESTMKPKRLPPDQWPTKRNLHLPEGSDFRYERVLKNPDNINHCLDAGIFVGSNQDRPLRAKLLLWAHMVEEPVFDTLRTKEQLGYIVSSHAFVNGSIACWRVLIQSEKDCTYLEERVDNFLIRFEETLMEMSEEEFESHKVSVINKRLEKLKNLGQESGRFWHHIAGEVFDFELVYRDVEHIEPLTKQDMLVFYHKLIHPHSPSRTKAAVYLIAQSSAADLASKTSSSEKKEKLVGVITQMLQQLGLEDANTSDVAKRLDKIDITSGDQEGIVNAMGSYLKDAAGMAAEQVDEVMAQGRMVLQSVLPSLGIAAKDGAEQVADGNGAHSKHVNDNHANGDQANGHVANGTASRKTIVIENVKAFKTSMPLTAGPRPVKDLSEYEELEAKL